MSTRMLRLPHQVRYKPAETMFIDASRTDTKNLWLWANWGELLVMQGKLEMAREIRGR